MAETILVSTRKGLFTVERNGGRGKPWRIAKGDFLGDNVTLCSEDRRDGRLYAALDHGHFGVKLHRRGAQGKWEEIAAPVYPEKPQELVDTDGWGKPLPWTTMRIWALEPGGANETGVLWCGTIPGGFFRSADNGASWEMVRPLWDHPKRRNWFGGGADWPGIHSICIDPRDSKTIRLGVSCGGVWLTRDGGLSWECKADGMRAAYMPPERAYDPTIQDAHYLAQCRAEPNKLWVQHHNGIFVSRDAGESWQELQDVKPSSFGFAVAVHPDKGDTAWFVPGVSDERRIPPSGQLVVTRTLDGGKSFEALRKGLPQEHAYDVVFRHGLAVDDNGERLAFGSTTGGLWVSEDQGDSWFEVSHSLPPVYAVRFVETAQH
jgi:hypothetical protein